MSNDVSLFGGEMRIGKTGIFTYCHEYSHSASKTTVKLIGTTHLGERTYYRKIRQLLHDMSLILHEHLSIDSKEQLTEDLVDLENDIRGNGQLIQRFISALSLYFTATDLYFCNRFLMEAHAFQNETSSKKWISVRPESCADLEKKLVKFCTHIPEERQNKVVAHVKSALALMKQKKYSAPEYGESFVFFWSDDQMRALFDKVLLPKVTGTCVEFFERSERKKPHTIGMKFGAAHIYALRKALESRSFEHVRSQQLCAISF